MNLGTVGELFEIVICILKDQIFQNFEDLFLIRHVDCARKEFGTFAAVSYIDCECGSSKNVNILTH